MNFNRPIKLRWENFYHWRKKSVNIFSYYMNHSWSGIYTELYINKTVLYIYFLYYFYSFDLHLLSLRSNFK